MNMMMQAFIITLLVLIPIFYAIPSVTNFCHKILSNIINRYLLWKYSTKSIDGRLDIPTCPYSWPNGQGDVAKFLEGITNSSLWSKEFGGIYRIWSGMTPEIVLTRPEDIRTVFADSDKHFKGINNNSGWLMGEILGKCLGLLGSDKWSKLKSVTEGPFLHHNASNYIPRIERHTSDHFNTIDRGDLSRKGLLNPVDDLKSLPFWVIADLLYGELPPDMKAELKALIPIREALFKRVISGGLSRFSWSRFLPTETNKILYRFKTSWRTFNQKAYLYALSQKNYAPIIHMHEAIKKGKANIEEIDQTIDEMLFANLDVTIGGISWNVVFLAASQQTQKTLREEVFAKLAEAEKDQKAWEKYLLSSSTLLASCIFESSRLKPLAAFSVPQSAPTARTLSGFLVPAGTNFLVDSYALNIRNPYWGEDNTCYRPERFFGKTAVANRYNFWRFGFGPRQCLGKYVADLIIRVLLAYLVRNYRIEIKESGREWDRNTEVWITHPDIDVRCDQLENSG